MYELLIDYNSLTHSLIIKISINYNLIYHFIFIFLIIFYYHNIFIAPDSLTQSHVINHQGWHIICYLPLPDKNRSQKCKNGSKPSETRIFDAVCLQHIPRNVLESKSLKEIPLPLSFPQTLGGTIFFPFLAHNRDTIFLAFIHHFFLPFPPFSLLSIWL